MACVTEAQACFPGGSCSFTAPTSLLPSSLSYTICSLLHCGFGSWQSMTLNLKIRKWLLRNGTVWARCQEIRPLLPLSCPPMSTTPFGSLPSTNMALGNPALCLRLWSHLRQVSQGSTLFQITWKGCQSLDCSFCGEDLKKCCVHTLCFQS